MKNYNDDYDEGYDEGYKSKKTKKKIKKWKKILLIVISIVLVLVLAALGVVIYMFKGMKVNRISKSNEELGISESFRDDYKNSNVKTIALFGLDGRDQSKIEGRTDSLMILAFNTKTNQVKLASILRDSYVSVDGHGKQKITHAFAYGGSELALKTVNQNYHLNITDYVAVNFQGFMNIIDSIGGVDVEITAAESTKIPNVAAGTAGTIHMNGEQALAYSRIRYIDSDNRRANRQKTILVAMLKKAKTINPLQYVGLVKNMMDQVETSLSYTDFISLSKVLTKIDDNNIAQTNVPNESENPWGGIDPEYGLWIWKYDLEAASTRLGRFIYEEW